MHTPKPGDQYSPGIDDDAQEINCHQCLETQCVDIPCSQRQPRHTQADLRLRPYRLSLGPHMRRMFSPKPSHSTTTKRSTPRRLDITAATRRHPEPPDSADALERLFWILHLDSCHSRLAQPSTTSCPSCTGPTISPDADADPDPSCGGTTSRRAHARMSLMFPLPTPGASATESRAAYRKSLDLSELARCRLWDAKGNDGRDNVRVCAIRRYGQWWRAGDCDDDNGFASLFWLVGGSCRSVPIMRCLGECEFFFYCLAWNEAECERRVA
jgi:hypothetical protein